MCIIHLAERLIPLFLLLEPLVGLACAEPPISSSFRASCRIRTNDPEITNHVLWPTELKRLIKPFAQTNPCETGANLGIILQMQNFFTDFFKYLPVFLCICQAVFQLQPAIPLPILQMCRKSSRQIIPFLAAQQ